MEEDIQDVLQEEKEEKLLTVAERDMKRGENLMVHEDEIKGRPRRTWFESEKDKKGAKEAGKRELNGDVVVKGAKKGKLSNKEKKKLDLRDERTDGRAWKKGKGDGKTGKPVAGKAGRDKKGGATKMRGGKSKTGDSMPKRNKR